MKRISIVLLLPIYLILVLMPNTTNSQEMFSNQRSLILDSDTSVILPNFDTSAVLGSNINSITLSLYVLDKDPGGASQAQITINTVDLTTKKIDDGLSTFTAVKQGEYLNLNLPRELFEQIIGTNKRFVLSVVNSDQKIVLAGHDVSGTAQDPHLSVNYSDPQIETSTTDQPIIINNHYNFGSIENSQFHFGGGDNVGNNKFDTVDSTNQSDIPFWLKLVVSLLTIFGVVWGVYIYINPNNNNISQIHSGQGDNVSGDKIINK